MDNPTSWPLGVVYLYLTEKCNLKCVHCWLEAEDKNIKYKEPELADYERFIRQAKPLGLNLVKVSGGEPLIRKDLLKELLLLCKDLSIRNVVETNGTLITDDAAEVLKKTNTPISISLDSIDPDEHNLFRGAPTAFKRLENGLSILEKYQVEVQAIMTLTRNNVDQVEKMIDFLKKKLNIRNLKINPVIPTGRAAKIKDKDIFLNAAELYHVSQDIHALSESMKFPILLHLPPAFRPLSAVAKKLCGGKCSFTTLLGLLANGNISFCGVGYTRPGYIFGSILDTNLDLKKIWETN
ncbi:MAG: radical SAM protein, partial [Candidatus Aminicenantes bacterium]|nr:radical SAM protein [Candidatus Aminicenantes bacterium]